MSRLASEQDQLPGLDLARLRPWLDAHVGSAGTPLRGRLLAGGRSNLTFEVTDGDAVWILRRPPLGHVLATAHDMAREHRVLTALADTSVPVPRTFAYCGDEDVIGSPFYLMERVDGTPYRRADELAELGADRTAALSRQFVTVLAQLHRVDPAAVGLADFGRPVGFLSRQVRRWKNQIDASYCRELPAAAELHRRLEAGVGRVESRVGRPAIVHGDYRVDNVLVVQTPDGDRINAVLDWEMATLGDPLTDLAVLVVYQRMAAWAAGGDTDDATLAPGWLDERDVIAAYEQVGGEGLADFGFYLGLAAFKVAAILEGIHYRYLHGQTVGPGFDTVGDSIHPLLEAGLAALDS